MIWRGGGEIILVRTPHVMIWRGGGDNIGEDPPCNDMEKGGGGGDNIGEDL